MNDLSPTSTRSLPFIDLQSQRHRIGDRIDAAIQRVLAHGQFILGPEVGALEAALSLRTGGTPCVACASGTDALVSILMAAGIGRDDAVIVPAFTFVASAESVVLAGAVPVFADVDRATFNMGAAEAAEAIAAARRAGLRPRAIMAVDLFGHPADYDALNALADAEGLVLVADAAQSFGADYRGNPVGALAPYTGTSFYPAKPLGCYGDGGAVFVRDEEAAARLRSIIVHGMGRDRYEHDRIGFNGRLDTIQAAVLLAKLDIFDDEIRARQRIAAAYSEALAELVAVPPVDPHASPVWAQYTIVVDDRDGLRNALHGAGVPTAVYYPIPLHRQAPYRDYVRSASLDNAEWLAERVVSIPFHPYLEPVDRQRVVAALRTALSGPWRVRSTG